MRARAVITVDDGPSPLFLRIARGIGDDVTRGRLRVGEALPGTRALADTLGVNRNTVVAAYRELVADGWAVTRPGGGTFVADGPRPRARAFAGALRPVEVAATPAFALCDVEDASFPSHPDGTLLLDRGVPDARLVERPLIARAFRRALAGRGGVGLLEYGDSYGDPRLRVAIANLVREGRGIPASVDNVLVVSGSQMGSSSRCAQSSHAGAPLPWSRSATVPRGSRLLAPARGCCRSPWTTAAWTSRLSPGSRAANRFARCT
jgi:GntR family transcriptional regulator/MocR family aminotransferase